MTNIITFYTHSNTLHLLMNAVVHVKGFISGLVSRVGAQVSIELVIFNGVVISRRWKPNNEIIINILT